MEGFLDINSPKWLGGTNVHNTITIGLLLFVGYRLGAFKR